MFVIFSKIFRELHLLAKIGNRSRAKTLAAKIWKKFLPPPKSYPIPSFRHCKREGHQWILDLSQWLDWHFYFRLESPEDLVFLSLLQPGHHVLDGGAYIGTVAIRAAARVGQSGYVYCFEANTGNFQRLQRHMELNRCFNVRCYLNALSDKTGTLEIAQPWAENLSGSLVSQGAWQNCPTEKVEGLSLDDWMERERIQRLDVVKLDVEGYEPNVLRGGRRLLAKFRPVLFLEAHELNLQRQGLSSAHLRKELESLNYQVREIPGELTHWVGLPH